MNATAKLLLDYIREVLFYPEHAALDCDELDGDFRELGEALSFFARCMAEQRELAMALSKGDLKEPPLPETRPADTNELVAPLVALHANLRHVTWQTQQVAKGDYRQRIDFMGDFADAFNTMVEQLDVRQQALEREIERGREKAHALEQLNSLMTNITYNIPQMIIVFSEDNRNVLFTNKAASEALALDHSLRDKLLRVSEQCPDSGPAGGCDTGLTYDNGAEIRFLSTTFYLVQWNGQNARALLLSDISDDVERVKELEQYAYQDHLTCLHNRLFGMEILSRWIGENRHFSLVFADLDNLKYVNDTYGHAEGDVYIKKAARTLETASPDCIACRLGGDEFMVLIPGFTEEEALARLRHVCRRMAEDTVSKPYFCRISYGIVEVKPDNAIPANVILGLADERMYAFKRLHKKERRG